MKIKTYNTHILFSDVMYDQTLILVAMFISANNDVMQQLRQRQGMLFKNNIIAAKNLSLFNMFKCNAAFTVVKKF